MSKNELRDEIRMLTESYIQRGMSIEVLPARRFLTPSCKWMEKYGWDYLPWHCIQDDSQLGYTYWLGDNNYLTKPQHLED